MINKHCFAQQVLKNSNISIYAGKSKILNNSQDIYNNFKLTSEWILNKHLSISNKNIRFLDKYDDLLKLGLQVSRKSTRGSYKNFSGQRVQYFLVRNGLGYPHLGYIPGDHKIEYNFIENWIRLIGRNSSGIKVYLKRTRAFGQYKEPNIEDYMTIYEDFIEEDHPFTYQQIEKKILIKEIPLILTFDGKLVCLPMTKDQPTIGVFGKKGMGKTMILHRFADSFYHKWNKRVFIANDGLSFQTKSWSLPWDVESKDNLMIEGKRTSYTFIKWLSTIGELTKPLPCVYLIPSTNDLGRIDLEGDITYKISLSFKDIIENPNLFFAETKEDLGASEKYLKNMIYDNYGNVRPDGLLYVKNINDIHKLVNEKRWQEVSREVRGKLLTERYEKFVIEHEGVRGKLFNLLKEVFKEQLFDINTQINSKWNVEIEEHKSELYPWAAILWADVVPVLLTHNLRTKKYFSSYMRFIFENVFKMQSENELIKRNNLDLWLIIDEIQSLMNHPATKETIIKICKEGRFNRLGMIYATQWVDDIPAEMKLTTDYIISFQQNSEEAKKIAGNFDFMKYQEQDLVLLKKYHATIAANAGKPLIIYDTEGNREIFDDGTPFKGLIFPSISRHSAPKEEGI